MSCLFSQLLGMLINMFSFFVLFANKYMLTCQVEYASYLSILTLPNYMWDFLR